MSTESKTAIDSKEESQMQDLDEAIQESMPGITDVTIETMVSVAETAAERARELDEKERPKSERPKQRGRARSAAPRPMSLVGGPPRSALAAWSTDLSHQGPVRPSPVPYIVSAGDPGLAQGLFAAPAPRVETPDVDRASVMSERETDRRIRKLEATVEDLSEDNKAVRSDLDSALYQLRKLQDKMGRIDDATQEILRMSRSEARRDRSPSAESDYRSIAPEGEVSEQRRSPTPLRSPRWESPLPVSRTARPAPHRLDEDGGFTFVTTSGPVPYVSQDAARRRLDSHIDRVRATVTSKEPAGKASSSRRYRDA